MLGLGYSWRWGAEARRMQGQGGRHRARSLRNGGVIVSTLRVDTSGACGDEARRTQGSVEAKVFNVTRGVHRETPRDPLVTLPLCSLGVSGRAIDEIRTFI